MEQNGVQEIIEELGDLELACLVCFVADQHCIVRAAEEQLDNVQHELETVCWTTYGFSCATLDCNAETSLEEFSASVLSNSDDNDGREETQRGPVSSVTFNSLRRAVSKSANTLDSRRVANIVIAKNLNLAPHNIQIQALELIRSRRIYSRTSAHAAPKRFLFVALLSTSVPGPPYLTPHLNDLFFISHTYDPEARSFEFSTAKNSPDAVSISSQSSVVHKPSSDPKLFLHPHHRALISEDTLAHLQRLTAAVRTTSEIRRHTHDVLTFLRLHRAVAGGVSALSSRHLSLLTRVLAPLHTQSYVTPSLVALAAPKVLAHRLEVVAVPEAERTMQWGSDVAAVGAVLERYRGAPETVVEEVLEEVAVPL